MSLSTFIFLLIPGSLMILKLAVMAFAIAWIARSFYQPGKLSIMAAKGQAVVPALTAKRH